MCRLVNCEIGLNLSEYACALATFQTRQEWCLVTFDSVHTHASIAFRLDHLSDVVCCEFILEGSPWSVEEAYGDSLCSDSGEE